MGRIFPCEVCCLELSLPTTKALSFQGNVLQVAPFCTGKATSLPHSLGRVHGNSSLQSLRTAITRYLGLIAYKQREVLLIVVEAGTSVIKFPEH